jgi:hypothetical protein
MNIEQDYKREFEVRTGKKAPADNYVADPQVFESMIAEEKKKLLEQGEITNASR